MGFIEAYKRLEKLCGEILNDDRRVSAYIDEMINTPRGAYLVRGWDEDLKQLKHYRWVRNQIVHDPSCSEVNMCDDDDTQWIVNFHARIMNQTDPLALYRQATQTQPKEREKQEPERYEYDQGYTNYHKTNNRSGCLVALLSAIFILVIASLSIFYWLLW